MTTSIVKSLKPNCTQGCSGSPEETRSKKKESLFHRRWPGDPLVHGKKVWKDKSESIWPQQQPGVLARVGGDPEERGICGTSSEGRPRSLSWHVSFFWYSSWFNYAFLVLTWSAQGGWIWIRFPSRWREGDSVLAEGGQLPDWEQGPQIWGIFGHKISKNLAFHTTWLVTLLSMGGWGCCQLLETCLLGFLEHYQTIPSFRQLCIWRHPLTQATTEYR